MAVGAEAEEDRLAEATGCPRSPRGGRGRGRGSPARGYLPKRFKRDSPTRERRAPGSCAAAADREERQGDHDLGQVLPSACHRSAAAARPLAAKRPVGRHWRNRITRTEDRHLRVHRGGGAADRRLEELVGHADAEGRQDGPQQISPTPPRTTTMNESTMYFLPTSGSDGADQGERAAGQAGEGGAEREGAASTRRVGTPRHAAMARFCMTARTFSPAYGPEEQERRPRRARDGGQSAMMKIRLYGSTRPGITSTPPRTASVAGVHARLVAEPETGALLQHHPQRPR